MALLLVAQLKQLGIISGRLPVGSTVGTLDRDTVTLALKRERCDEALNLGCLCVCLLGLLALASGNLTPDDVLANVVALLKREELADLRSALGAKAARDVGISEAWNFGSTLLDDDQVKDGNLGANNATTNRLALALTSAAGPVALVG